MSNDEQWRPVLGFEGCYEVSDLGRVRSVTRTHKHRGGLRRVRSRPIALVPDTDKRSRAHCYVGVVLSVGGRATRKRVHALVLEAFVGPRPAHADVRHLNGIDDDNRLVNLAWGTREENCADQALHGTRPRGTRKANAKLTEQDIPLLREGLASGTSQYALARQYGVSQQAVSAVARRITWSHVPS